MARFGFSANEYEPDTGGGGNYDPIPEGEYELMCEEAEDKKTSAGTGVYIKAKFRVLGPTNAGRFIFMNFNIQNPSTKAEEIGRRQVSGWAAACGRPNAADTDELLNLPFRAKITVEPGSGNYGPQNRINGYLVKEGGGAPKASVAPKAASAPAPTPAAPSTPAAVASSAAASPSKPAGKKAPWDE